MAQKKKTADPGFLKLKNDLASKEIGRAYLFHGEESYLREYYLSQLREALVPAGFEEFNYHRLEGKGLTAQALTEAAEAMPMMAERTMVQVVDWDLFKLAEDQRKVLITLLEDLPDYCCLVFVYEHLEYKPVKTYKKLCAALDKSVRTVRFEEQSQRDLLRWIDKRFQAEGHSIGQGAAEHLIFTCGSLMNGLIPEIGKIAAYAKGEQITKEDIDAVAAPVLEAQVFEMTNALSKGNFDRAAEVLGALLKLQEEPFRILAVVGMEVRRLYTARTAIDSHRDKFWLMERCGIRSDYPARLLMENARRVDRRWCALAVRRCCELDTRLKSVNGADGAAELKLLLMELAQEARQ